MGTTVDHVIAAEVFAPGEYIQEELEARGWTEADLAGLMGRSVGDVTELLAGRLRLSVEMAKELAAAFGTSTDVWLGLEEDYRSRLVNSP
jgi:HTH-type transcriptional regulator/antitoxin HigA